MKLNDYEVPDLEFQIKTNMPIGSQDLSGETSSTASSFKGFKAFVFSCRFMIRTNEPELLAGFLSVLRALDDKGDQKVYEIVDDLADACNVNQVTFFERFQVSKSPELEAWIVDFKLKEYISAPEKNEARQDTSTAQSGQSSAGEQTVDAPQPTPEQPIDRELTWIEEFLQKGEEITKPWVDNFLEEDKDSEENPDVKAKASA